MDLQFVEQPFGVGIGLWNHCGRPLVSWPLAQPVFGSPAQLGGMVNGWRLDIHGRVSCRSPVTI
jgi:hypothetical protein